MRIFWNHSRNLDSERERYDLNASRELANIHNLPRDGYSHFPPEHVAPFRKYYSSIEGALKVGGIEVLEIGAGTGLHTRPVISPSNRVTALDISGLSLSILHRRFAGEVQTQLGNMEDMPFLDCSFDLVISCGALSYGDPKKVDSEIVRVLKPGGTFIFLDSLNHNLIYKANRYFRFLRGSRSFSTVIRIPKLSRIRRMESSFADSAISYFGVWTWVFSLLRHILGEKLSYRIYENLERIELGHKYAFKVVGEFKNCKK